MNLDKCRTCGELFKSHWDAAACCAYRGACGNNGCTKQVGHCSNCAPTQGGTRAHYRRKIDQLVAEAVGQFPGGGELPAEDVSDMLREAAEKLMAKGAA